MNFSTLKLIFVFILGSIIACNSDDDLEEANYPVRYVISDLEMLETGLYLLEENGTLEIPFQGSFTSFFDQIPNSVQDSSAFILKSIVFLSSSKLRIEMAANSTILNSPVVDYERTTSDLIQFDINTDVNNIRISLNYTIGGSSVNYCLLGRSYSKFDGNQVEYSNLLLDPCKQITQDFSVLAESTSEDHLLSDNDTIAISKSNVVLNR